jgi:hypothetical protein
MTPQVQEIERLKSEIKVEVQTLFKANMKIFDWDIPENDDRKSAQLIVEAMQEALDEIKADVQSGKYDQY